MSNYVEKLLKMKYFSTFSLLFFLNACFQDNGDCTQFDLAADSLYQNLSQLDRDLTLRVQTFDQEKPEDLQTDKNYQEILNLNIKRDELKAEFLGLSELHPECTFQKNSELGLELKQYVLDHQEASNQ
jgi:hypothetical protein